MFIIQNEWLSCAVREDAQLFTLLDLKSRRSCNLPEKFFILHCRTADDREILFHAASQKTPRILLTNHIMTIFYPCLANEEQNWNIHLLFVLSLDEKRLRIEMAIENSSDCRICAIQYFSFSEDFGHNPIEKGEYRRLTPRFISIAEAGTSRIV